VRSDSAFIHGHAIRDPAVQEQSEGLMAGTTTDITITIAALSDAGFQAFCDGVAAMFDVDARCERRQAGVETAAVLQSRFKKLAAIHVVTAEGALNGTFHLLFDQGGLFILSGVVVMLPESRILEQVRRGSIQDAQNLQDAAGEVGNLLVGSWDTLFREQCAGHRHFVKKTSIIGKLSEKAGEMGLSANGQVLCIPYEMTVGPHPSFVCAAVFPVAILASFSGAGMELISEPLAVEQPPSVPVSKAPSPGGVIRPASPDGGRTPDVASRPQSAGLVTAAECPPASDGGAAPTAVFSPGVSDVLPGRPSAGAPAELLRARAADIMETDLVWAGPEDTVQAVLAKMQQNNTGYVLIGQNGLLEGLVSSSTILGAVSLYLRPVFAKWRRPEDDATLGVKVKWIMSRPVRTIRPDTSLEATIEYMRRYGGRCLPVVDEKGAVQGMVTVFDILMRILASDKNLSWQGRPPQAPALLL
jgi:CBS domain-containing protein